MDTAMTINATIRFVESHIKAPMDYAALEKATGFSYRHLREEFRMQVKVPLKQYVNARKIAYAAFEIETTRRSLLEIATEYGFDSYDTFTRCFRRETGLTPKEYRSKGLHNTRRTQIGLGTYAPALHLSSNSHTVGRIHRKTDGILYGVPKVEYATGKGIPFVACLESLLAYEGQRRNCSYQWLSSATGAAFRLCWKEGEWDMGNSLLTNLTPAHPFEMLERTARAAGWSCRILSRENASKEAFWDRITAEIHVGRPVIALGIIGPPEACILTGYREEGNGLLGWSFFQEAPELCAHVRIDETGYFHSTDWWENPATTALVTLDRPAAEVAVSQVLRQILQVLRMDRAGAYRAGQSAYRCWANDIGKIAHANSITPRLLPAFFCQADAESTVAEGRYWGARFFDELGAQRKDLAGECGHAAEILRETAEYARQMTAVRGGEEQTEEAVARFFRPEIRRELMALIERARQSEKRAAEIIERIADRWG